MRTMIHGTATSGLRYLCILGLLVTFDAHAAAARDTSGVIEEIMNLEERDSSVEVEPLTRANAAEIVYHKWCAIFNPST